MKDQANFEKLKLARRHRQVFTERITFRVDHQQMKELNELSDKTGRTVADLLRASAELVLFVSHRVSPWNLEESVKSARSEGE